MISTFLDIEKGYTDFVMRSVFRFFCKLIERTQRAGAGTTTKSNEHICHGEKVMGVKVGYCIRPAGCRCSAGKQMLYKPEDSEDEICGDTVTWCNLRRGKKALFLSDGMGKGKEAALCSQKAVRKLRFCLKNDYSTPQALRAANDFIIEQKVLQNLREDDFATIDLAIIDFNKGKASFYKMGATASFLVRGEKVTKIHQNSLPAGIIQDVDVSHFTVNIEPGDMIILASDGVVAADREDFEGGWLIKILALYGPKIKRRAEQRPRIIASEIMDMAVRRSDGYEEDDMTILAAVITED